MKNYLSADISNMISLEILLELKDGSEAELKRIQVAEMAGTVVKIIGLTELRQNSTVKIKKSTLLLSSFNRRVLIYLNLKF